MPVFRGTVGVSKAEKQGTDDQACNKSIEKWKEKAAWVRRLEVRIDKEESEEWCREYLRGYQPAIPFLERRKLLLGGLQKGL